MGGGGNMPSSPRYNGGRRGSSSPRRGRGRSKSGSRSRSRSRDGRRKGRSRAGSSGRYVSPDRRRPAPSSPPPRRPLYERIQHSRSSRPRSHSPKRSRSPRHRRPQDRRPRGRTPTPISSSRGPSHTPPPKRGKVDRSLRTVKVESPVDAVPKMLSSPVNPAPGNTSTAAADDQPPVPPRASADRNQNQEPSLDLSSVGHATAASTSPQPTSSRADPFSPIFAPETPVIPGFPTALFTQPQLTTMPALQKTLELVIRDQATNSTIRPSTTLLSVQPLIPRPATIPEGEKTEIWTTRVKCVEFACLCERDQSFY